MRLASVPPIAGSVLPATGSASYQPWNHDRDLALINSWVSSAGLTMSYRDSPEPSNWLYLLGSMPSAPSLVVSALTPAPKLPEPSRSTPADLVSVSASRLLLCLSSVGISWPMVVEVWLATVGRPVGIFWNAVVPATETPAAASAWRNSDAVKAVGLSTDVWLVTAGAPAAMLPLTVIVFVPCTRFTDRPVVVPVVAVLAIVT